MFATRLASIALKSQGSLMAVRSMKPVTNSLVTVTREFRSAGMSTLKARSTNARTSIGIKSKTGLPLGMEVGQVAVGAAGVAGLVTLCFYGLGLSNERGAIDNMVMWPEFVRTRIRDTYLYFGASVGAVAGSAIAFYRSPMGLRFNNFCARHPLMSTVGTIAALIASGQIMMNIPYQQGLGVKQVAWLANCAVLGVALSPLVSLGGAIAMQAATYTAGLCGGLSMISVCAPSEQFLKWAGPLGMGLGAVVVASLGSAFLPVTSRLGMGLYAFSLYGGLILFSCFLIYDTQKIIYKAQHHPTYAMTPYDPINNSHRIVLDTLNIFVRIVTILTMNGGRRK